MRGLPPSGLAPGPQRHARASPRGSRRGKESRESPASRWSIAPVQEPASTTIPMPRVSVERRMAGLRGPLNVCDPEVGKLCSWQSSQSLRPVLASPRLYLAGETGVRLARKEKVRLCQIGYECYRSWLSSSPSPGRLYKSSKPSKSRSKPTMPAWGATRAGCLLVSRPFEEGAADVTYYTETRPREILLREILSGHICL
jgi:hypothetical protein